ncbi:MAG: hypothetical protein IH804_04510, partial [Planctomycetes bacterium]|nr:hypothetical protein [Planctomycetota bacterium]
MIHDRTRPLRPSGRVTMTTLASIAAAGIAVALGAAPGAPVKDGQATEPPELIASVKEALGLTAGTIVGLEVADAPGIPMQAVVPLDGQLVTLDLAPHSVRSEDYQVFAQIEGGKLVPVPPAPIRTLRGVVAEIPGSKVAASVLPDGLHAMILLPEGDRFWVQPVAPSVEGAPENLHVVYHDDDTLPAGTCGVNDRWLADQGDPNDGPLGGGGSGNCTPVEAQLGCDADFEFYVDFGSSVTNVENRINSIINTCNVQYVNDVGIVHAITIIIVRTTVNDPYTAGTLGGLLDQFRIRWNNNHAEHGVPHDLAQLFTGRNLSGGVLGVAYVPGFTTVCGSFGYSVVENIGSFGCATDLSAHEMGHNWSADHCDCAGWTMNSGLTCANQFHPTFTIPQIINFRNSRTCLECLCQGDDGLEPNDSCAAATALPAGTSPNLVVELADEDWYTVSIGTLASLTVDASFSHALGD